MDTLDGTEVDPAERTGPISVHESWLPSDHPLHRPRHGRRQRLALVCAALFFLTPWLAFALGARPHEIENHRLAAFPSVRDGWGFFTALPRWATDHLPLRELGVRAADRISRGPFGEPPPFVQTPPIDQTGANPASPGPVHPAAGYPEVIEGSQGWLYFGFDVSGKCRPVRSMDEIVSGLDRLRDAVESSGRSFVLVVAPDKATMVPEHLPASYVGKDCAAARDAEFWRRIAATKAIDLRPDLAVVSARTGSPDYFALDSHWTDLGALVMLRAVAERLDPGISSTWQLGPGPEDPRPADLPTLLGRDGFVAERIYALSPDGSDNRAAAVSRDMSSPVRLTGRPGVGVLDRSVGLLGDSFTLPATRYLPAVFADTRVLSYGVALSNPQAIADLLVDRQVVVLEVVERNLASGAAPFLDPAVVDTVRSTLAAHRFR